MQKLQSSRLSELGIFAANLSMPCKAKLFVRRVKTLLSESSRNDMFSALSRTKPVPNGVGLGPDMTAHADASIYC